MSSYEMPKLSDTTRSVLLDYRAPEDDAWYSVRLILKDETLTVKFHDFPHGLFDKIFRTSDFQTLDALEDFKNRFRPTCTQLQDDECRDVIGTTVCVSQPCGIDELKFYDAVVESVRPSEHEFVNLEEVCTCAFSVFWKHGPNAGSKTLTGIEHICLISSESSHRDRNLEFFLELVRKKFDLAAETSLNTGSGILVPKDAICRTNATTVKKKSKKPFPETPVCHAKIKDELIFQSAYLVTDFSDEAKNHMQTCNTRQTFKGKNGIGCRKIGQDTDLGGGYIYAEHLGVTSNYFILIDNLEKDISPAEIVDFIYQETSILVQACVSPSLSWETHTRGAISLESREKLESLSEFLHSSDHLILSSGRPWVITEKDGRLGTFGGFWPVSEKPLQIKKEHVDKINVVRKGTKEYESGEKLRDLFLEFDEHLQRLHNRLAREENKLIQ